MLSRPCPYPFPPPDLQRHQLRRITNKIFPSSPSVSMSMAQITLACARWIVSRLCHPLFRPTAQWRLPALHLSLVTAHARQLRPRPQHPRLTHPWLHLVPRRLQEPHARLHHRRPQDRRHRRPPANPTGLFTVVAAHSWPR